MANGRRVQFRGVLACLGAMILFAFLLLLCGWLCVAFIRGVLPLFEPPSDDVTHTAIATSATWPIFFWCLGWPILLRNPPRELGRRSAWTLGCLTCLIHIAVAFHVGHGWSHEAAWKHTQQVGGYGDGIYVNYAFALVWLADVIWMWAASESYRNRPRWLKWSIHGFLAFVIISAVAFGSRELQACFFLFFTIILVTVIRHAITLSK
jgi:hypothetical protein